MRRLEIFVLSDSLRRFHDANEFRGLFLIGPLFRNSNLYRLYHIVQHIIPWNNFI